MTERQKLMDIPLNRFMVCPSNTRKFGAMLNIDALTSSMAKEGQKESIHVHWSEEDKKFHVMAGQRRFFAAKKAELHSLECRVHHEIKSCEEAKAWCIPHLWNQEKHSALNLVLTVLEMMRDFKSVKEACQLYKVPYARVKKYIPIAKGLNPKTIETLLKNPERATYRNLQALSKFSPKEQLKQLPIMRKRNLWKAKGNSSPNSTSTFSQIGDGQQLFIVPIPSHVLSKLLSKARDQNMRAEELIAKIVEESL